MAFTIKGELEGLEETMAALRRLKPSKGRAILRKGLTKATRILAKGAKSRAPKGPTGLLKKSIGSKVKTYPKGAVVGLVGARKGHKKVIDGRNVDPARYSHLSERGRRAVQAKGKALLIRGKEPLFFKRAAAAAGKGWLRAAWSAGKPQAQRVIVETIRADLVKLLAKGK
jgi:Bacteriophage HK97-gp10, putative tail-component